MNDVVQPTATRLFMFGQPANNDLNPSITILRTIRAGGMWA